MIDLVRRTRPDVIITHAPNDYMSDHIATSQVVCDASFLAATPLPKTAYEACDKIAPVFFMDTVGGLGFLPEEYVDISEQFEKKKEMLSCHDSQITFVEKHHRGDLLELAEVTGRIRGLQSGARYAEGFRRHDVWERNVTRRLLP